MVGLKRGEVILVDNQKDWSEKAKAIIENLKKIFGCTATDMQHTGSTSIRNIKAKPMLDIAVSVTSFDNLTDIFSELDKIGIYKSPHDRAGYSKGKNEFIVNMLQEAGEFYCGGEK